MGKRMAMAMIMFLLIGMTPALGKKPSNKEVNDLKNRIIKVNPKFFNPNLVRPGDTVFVPDKNGIIYPFCVWTPRADRGCIWQVAKTHLSGNQQSPVLAKPGFVKKLISSLQDWWQHNKSWLITMIEWLLGLMIGIILMSLFIRALRYLYSLCQENPNRQHRQSTRTQGAPAPGDRTVDMTNIRTADPRKVTVSIDDGTNKLTITAEGDIGTMPTKIEYSPGQKAIIFFPRGDAPRSEN